MSAGLRRALGPISRLVGAVLLVMAVRLLVVRTLEAPSWGDSVQHAVIAQLLKDHGGLFNSWEPYAPYRTLTVQFGFSVAVAMLSWVTRIESGESNIVDGPVTERSRNLGPLSIRPAHCRREPVGRHRRPSLWPACSCQCRPSTSIGGVTPSWLGRSCYRSRSGCCGTSWNPSVCRGQHMGWRV